MYFDRWLQDLMQGLETVSYAVKGLATTKENAFHQAKHVFDTAKAHRKKIVIVGNGGSSSIASHISQDIINKLNIASYVISDASLITCISNDFGYENVFSKPLDVLLDAEDVLIAISDSGESKNVLNSVQCAKAKKCKIITLSAFKSTNTLFQTAADVAFHVPTHNYGMAEVSHLAILHTVLDELAGMSVS